MGVVNIVSRYIYLAVGVDCSLILGSRLILNLYRLASFEDLD